VIAGSGVLTAVSCGIYRIEELRPEDRTHVLRKSANIVLSREEEGSIRI
jgi:hypothetical protein